MSLYNLRNPAVKRLMKEAEELRHATEEYHAQPIDDNLFEWHFSIIGPPNSDFEGGIYHGRITLPPDYPMKPPSIILLTPNGRFEINKKICLSISGYHPESWQPSWSIRTALLAIIGFMPTHGNGALGSLDYNPEERRLLALKSQDYKCPDCGSIKNIFSRTKSQALKVATIQDAPSTSETMNEINKAIVSSSGKPCAESAPESNSSENTTYRRPRKITLIHRFQTNTPSSVVPVPIVPPFDDYKNATRAATANEHSLLYFVFVVVIVSLIVILFLRRIFSL